MLWYSLEALLMSTHNIYFLWRNKKNVMCVPSLSGAMQIFLLLIIKPCPAEYIKMPHPLLIFSQSDFMSQIVAINSHT